MRRDAEYHGITQTISKIETHGVGNMTGCLHIEDFSEPSPTMLGILICNCYELIFPTKEAEVGVRGGCPSTPSNRSQILAPMTSISRHFNGGQLLEPTRDGIHEDLIQGESGQLR